MVVRLLLRWAIGVVAVAVTIFLADVLRLELSWPSVWGVIVFVPVLGAVNAVISPIVRALSLPISCVTFGLFNFVINALMFWLAGKVTGASMNFISALFGSIVVTFIESSLATAIRER